MPRTKEFDDSTVVRAARAVFCHDGYAGTSLAQLQAATGLSKSSLYETYGSKRGLYERAVQNYLDEFVGPILEPLEREGAGVAEVMGVFAHLARYFRTDPDRQAGSGCFLFNATTELAAVDAQAAATVLAFRRRLRRAFLHGLSGPPSPFPEPAVRADVLTASYIGTVVTARLDRGLAAELADTIVEDLRSSSAG